MNPMTIRLHFALIRHLKGLLRAWEDWLHEQQEADQKTGGSS